MYLQYLQKNDNLGAVCFVLSFKPWPNRCCFGGIQLQTISSSFNLQNSLNYCLHYLQDLQSPIKHFALTCCIDNFERLYWKNRNFISNWEILFCISYELPMTKIEVRNWGKIWKLHTFSSETSSINKSASAQIACACIPLAEQWHWSSGS